MIFGSWVSPSPKNISIDYCLVYGIVNFVDKASNADFVVFVESDESFADLIIFSEENPAMADTPGKWFTVSDQFLADYNIYITENISESDFTIAYTEFESFSGCND